MVIATTLLIVIPTQSTAATKESVSKPKSAGRTGSVTPNTILSGTTAPSSAIGINGDFYIDIKNANIYGPKSNGKWLTPTSLRGLSGINGINGIDGKNGADAKNIISASSSTGPQGVQGEKGATGSSGAQGAQGPAGASGSGTGPTGAKGDTGLSGAAGTSGTNGTNGTNGSVGAQGSTGSQGSIGLTGFTGSTGSTGAKGDTGLSGPTGTSGTNGTNGSAGVQGSIGLTGSTGSTGSVGPSNSYSGTVTFSSNLSGSAGTTKPSNNFGSFTGGKSYLVSIYVKTYNVTDNSVSYPINMTINSPGSGAVLTAYTYLATGSEYQNPGECLFTTLISELTIDGTGITGTFNIQVVPIIGAVGFNIAMIGKYFSTEVGQVG